MNNKSTIYTVGHSNRSLMEFIKLLKMYNVKVVVDVRRFPKSTKYPYFNKDNLSQALSKHDIGYLWLGYLLGGYRKGGYENYMKSKDYMNGIRKLIEVLNTYGSGKVAIMCSEKLWFKCHRRFIADTITSMGYTVIHIIDEGTTYKHRLRKKKLEPLVNTGENQ